MVLPYTILLIPPDVNLLLNKGTFVWTKTLTLVVFCSLVYRIEPDFSNFTPNVLFLFQDTMLHLVIVSS